MSTSAAMRSRAGFETVYRNEVGCPEEFAKAFEAMENGEVPHLPHAQS